MKNILRLLCTLIAVGCLIFIFIMWIKRPELSEMQVFLKYWKLETAAVVFGLLGLIGEYE